MEYIVILDSNTRFCTLMEDSDGFMIKFDTFKAAEEMAEIWRRIGVCQYYRIYQEVKE